MVYVLLILHSENQSGGVINKREPSQLNVM